MRFTYSLRFRLLLIYFLTIIVPSVIILATMPSYYRGLISKETGALTDSVSSALVKNIETYLDDLERLTITPYYNETFMKSLELINSSDYETLDYYTKFSTEQDLINNLNYYLQISRKDILGAVIVTNSGRLYNTTKRHGVTNQPENYDYKDESWYRQAEEANGTAVFINVHKQNYLSEQVADKVFSVARLIKGPDSGKPLAVLMADADTLVLKNVLANANFNVSSMVAIFDNDDSLIYSSRILSPEMIEQIKRGDKYASNPEDTFSIVSRSIPKSKWKLVVLLSNTSMNSKLGFVYVVGMLFTLGQLIIAFTLFTIFSRFITDPFKQMISVMQKVESGNLSVRYANKSKDEISQVGNALNNMIIKLNDTIEREYKAELSKRNAEFSALQAQINPHFLYNILNSFISLNRMGEKLKLENSIISLTALMRYTISHTAFSTIAEEFHFLEQYCELQKMRFNERLDYGLCFDSDIAGYKIPKLLLQPLVENAVIHGIEPLDRKGSINVAACACEKSGCRFLSISVVDDGCGFNAGSKELKRNIGLANVEERLKIAFANSTIELTSEIGKGTAIVITIPEEDMVK